MIYKSRTNSESDVIFWQGRWNADAGRVLLATKLEVAVAIIIMC